MLNPPQRHQQTIQRPVSVSGFGLFGGQDVDLVFCPAAVDTGIVFERVDLKPSVRIPAWIEYVVPQSRCTMISHQGATVSVIEHVMAALAGLQIDNCLVRLNAPEPPGCDGSSWAFVEALQSAGIVQQAAWRPVIEIEETLCFTENAQVGIAAQPSRSGELEIGFLLDYGPGPIGRQSLKLSITPETFVAELARCRTFALEREVQQLQSQGIALRSTTSNALVFGDQGLIANSLRFADECVRHKMLDCVGDFALLGCDIRGRFAAERSGHRHSHEIIRLIRSASHRHPFLRARSLALPTNSTLHLAASRPDAHHPTATLKAS
ncbi:UDP-3-O-acyl-N-acetylglucosamine deacetylase [Planctomicrobium sp. SH664]|uniref:UDP-3-O-acyl-N-acetylglucosamine deacetylase n=1 Tax=Planctomicrobium sp. SH664 TaxID=3448125 RepID=UPI003F5C3916